MAEVRSVLRIHLAGASLEKCGGGGGIDGDDGFGEGAEGEWGIFASAWDGDKLERVDDVGDRDKEDEKDKKFR